MARHKWEDDPAFGRGPADLNAFAGRVCARCGAVQRKTSRQNWGRVTGYEWGPPARLCVRLKWKKPERGRQESACGLYFVEQAAYGTWHPHRSGEDEAMTFTAFATRAEAKRFCEDKARNPADVPR